MTHVEAIPAGSWPVDFVITLVEMDSNGALQPVALDLVNDSASLTLDYSDATPGTTATKTLTGVLSAPNIVTFSAAEDDIPSTETGTLKAKCTLIKKSGPTTIGSWPTNTQEFLLT